MTRIRGRGITPQETATFVSGVIAAGTGIDATGATDSASALQAKIDNAVSLGAAVIVPRGTYAVSVPIERVQKLVLMPGAIIKATAAMAAVVRTDLSTNVRDGAITGKGVIDGNDLADYCVHARYFVRMEINGLNLRNGKVGGIKIGDSGAAGRSAEANLLNLHIERVAPLPVNAGSQGIVVENSGDHSMSSIIINAYETGVYLPSAGNAMVRDVHVWTDPSQGATKTCFEDHSNNSHYLQCHADTPSQYGFRLYGYQTTLLQCGTYNNPTAGNATDNVVVGVKFEGTNPIAVIVGHFFLGGSSTKRLAYDILAADGNYGLVNITPMVGQYVVTSNASRARVIGLDSRDPITSQQGMTVNAPAPSNSAGFLVQTNSKNRWALITDGAAETGSNAGSGLRLVRYADDGSQLGEVLFIARTGTLVMKSNMLMGPGANIIPDSAGSMIGTAATNKIGFWGTAPVAQPQTKGVTAGHTPGTGATVTADSTFTGNWGSTAYTLSDIISNLKQAGILKS